MNELNPNQELKYKQAITKLLSKTKNQKSEISRLKRDLEAYKSRDQVFLKALADRNCFPKFACSCFKDDCGCLEDSLRIK